MTSEQAKELLERYRLGQCTVQEARAVEKWFAELEKAGDWSWNDEEKQSLKNELFDKISIATEPAKVLTLDTGKRRLFRPLAAAVAIVVIFGTAAFFLLKPQPINETAAARQTQPVANDVLPGTQGATLTLADGKKIALDSARTGTLAQQGAAIVANNAGTLSYQHHSGNAGEVLYNTISTPRGFEYKMTLADGTKVWLNAGSSMHFPVVFGGNNRTVEVSGEVYFEVAGQRDGNGQRKPFVVQILSGNSKGGRVEVLGTHFNINAYDEEPDTRVTLLEGSVRLANDKAAPVTITPGQQAKLSDRITVTSDINVQEVVAWKEGFFRFANADVQTIMRQAARWYDINVTYPEGVPADILHGAISRSVSLSQFLQIIRYSEINATINEKTVVIKPGEH